MRNMNIEEIKKFNEHCDSLSTGHKFEVPRWASFLAILSIVIKRPIGCIPIIGFFTLCVYISGDINISSLLGGAILSSISLVVIVEGVAMRMAFNGVLEKYLSFIFSHYKFPMWLGEKVKRNI